MKHVNNRTLCIVHCASIIVLCAVMLGCKKDPKPTIDPLLEPGSASTPEWKYEPSRQTYGSMTAIVSIPVLFADYVSAGDKMAVFGQDGKVLSSATPLESYNNKYLLYIEQPAQGSALTMKWYCDKLHRIYEAKSFPNFAVDATLGVPDPIVPNF
ncbi:MAG: hypothetical protein MJZ58_00535 [Paludibacteraceae bacterium]|nr:hypothetical protein [Paludibacteraceae bacterium]